MTAELAREVVRLALDEGAAEAECTLAEGNEFSAGARMRQLETLKEAGSRAAGVRVLVGRRAGSSSTSDLSEDGLRRMVRSALELARIGTEDPFAGLPEADELGAIPGDLKLYCEQVERLDNQYKIQQALACEEAALAADPRIVNSEGAGFSTYTGARYFSNSRGFAGGYRSSNCALSVTPVARENGSMERDYWQSIARGPSGLESPEEVGRRAAQRAVRRLGARKLPTQRAAVLFDPRMARSLLGSLFEALDGESVYRHASFLEDCLGSQVASEKVTVIDDGTLPGLFGTSPFDDEGVPTRRTVVIERGVLKSYLLNTYTARKLGLKTTGNASRGLAGNPGAGPNNFYLENGGQSPEEMIASQRKALLVTELIGSGVNIVTGDYSRGAVGLWIENGEIAYPVSEITIAANLRDMLLGIDSIGNDLEFRGPVAAPTLLIPEMTISGR